MKKLVLLVSILTSASVAMAQPGQGAKGGAAPTGPQKGRMTPAEKFAKLDTNRDGVISKAEAAVAGRFAKHFDQLDANSDGMLTVAELTAAHEARKQKHMERRGEHFDLMDADKNGAISREEFVKHAPQRGQRGGKGHHGGKGGRGVKHGPGDQGARPGA
ncbi:MAG: EF-hand domain-containing protein [Myxococcales bacterium]|nr:EF-hand domain-containing protein [Myxococcales bacterium]